jgi:phage terminase large subunit-like protein
MTYAQSGTIQASDYNSFVGANTGGIAVNGELSTVWGRGRGDAGYGQVTPANVTVGNTITATQWSTFFNALNNMRRHQGLGSNVITALPVAGDTITFISAVSGNLTAGYGNRSNYGSSGTTTTGSVVNTAYSTTASTLYTVNVTRTVTFASADAARYFFNAGGRLVFNVTGITRTDATSRGATVIAFAPMLTAKTFGSANTSARSGSGGNSVNDVTNIGYWNLTTTDQTLFSAAATTAQYTDSTVTLRVRSNGQQDATYQDRGTVLTFTYTIVSGFQSAEAGLATTTDDIAGTISTRIDIINPETTFLTNTWGTITVA